MQKTHPDWEFSGVYWEAAVSGIKKENRPELFFVNGRSRREHLFLFMGKEEMINCQKIQRDLD